MVRCIITRVAFGVSSGLVVEIVLTFGDGPASMILWPRSILGDDVIACELGKIPRHGLVQQRAAT